MLTDLAAFVQTELDADLTKSLVNFRRLVRAEVRRLWRGDVDIYDFTAGMYSVLEVGFNNAWNEGAAGCGIRPEERTPEETQALWAMIQENRLYVFRFGEFIETNSKLNRGKLEDVYRRAELWVNAWNRVKAQAQTMACADQKLKWVWNPVKEHCADCLRLNGRVYRASIWAKYGIAPQSRGLACGGWKCGCGFEVTSDPVTPGRPPKLLG